MLYFPHPLLADDDGLLAVGGDLSPDRLLLAYRFGIFPWYDTPPILWWFTHPRCVLFPEKLKIHKSMRSYLNQDKYQMTFDTQFHSVISNCANTSRKGQNGTWINSGIMDSYVALHERGYAHSVEVWKEDELVGGLYGIALGKMFFGESMFAKAPNASKFGFIKLTQFLISNGFTMIDCQQETDHMKSLGAETITKMEFYNALKRNMIEVDAVGKWTQ